MPDLELMAKELMAAGWRVQPPMTQENCPHTFKTGSGSVSSDGAGHTEWSCPACGKHERFDYPARTKTE